MTPDRRGFLSAMAVLPCLPFLDRPGVLLRAGLSPFGAFGERLEPIPIVIDPGHGGRDPGCIGGQGTLEKDVVLDVALSMAAIMERHGGVRPILTRQADRFLPLEDRVEIARRANARLLLSVHADSAPTPLARGASTYSLARAPSDRFAEQIAWMENGGTERFDRNARTHLGMAIPGRSVLRVAQHLQHEIIDGLRGRVRILERPIRAADFAVLKAGEVPAVLIELGFLSSRADERLLKTRQWRYSMAFMLASQLVSFALAVPESAAIGRATG